MRGHTAHPLVSCLLSAPVQSVLPGLGSVPLWAPGLLGSWASPITYLGLLSPQISEPAVQQVCQVALLVDGFIQGCVCEWGGADGASDAIQLPGRGPASIRAAVLAD